MISALHSSRKVLWSSPWASFPSDRPSARCFTHFFLSRPVYGLIFLFRWIEDENGHESRDDDDEEEEDEESASSDIWFANQVSLSLNIPLPGD
jgi:hypothetical protein